MAEANGLLALFGIVSGRDVYPKMKATAERGYALDPESGETCTVLGGLRAWFEYRWDEAYRLYDRALELQPGLARAYRFRAMALLCQGDIKAAESGLRRSIELDPAFRQRLRADGLSSLRQRETIHRPQSISSSLSTWIAIIRKRDFTKDCCASSRKTTTRSYSVSRHRGSRWISACSPRLTLGKVASREPGECVERLHRLAGPPIRHAPGGSVSLRSE